MANLYEKGSSRKPQDRSDGGGIAAALENAFYTLVGAGDGFRRERKRHEEGAYQNSMLGNTLQQEGESQLAAAAATFGHTVLAGFDSAAEAAASASQTVISGLEKPAAILHDVQDPSRTIAKRYYTIVFAYQAARKRLINPGNGGDRDALGDGSRGQSLQPTGRSMSVHRITANFEKSLASLGFDPEGRLSNPDAARLKGPLNRLQEASDRADAERVPQLLTKLASSTGEEQGREEALRRIYGKSVPDNRPLRQKLGDRLRF